TQLRALRQAHAGDGDEVVGGRGGRLAVLAPAVDRPAGVAPGDWAGLGAMLGDHLVHARPAPLEYGPDLVDVRGLGAIVAEDELDLVVDGDAEPVELLVVGGELQERGHLDAPRELRVDDAV